MVMEIALTVDAAPDGRLTGVARHKAHDIALPFSGNLELLAALQRICVSESDAHDSAKDNDND